MQCLADCRDKISKELDINPEDLELSMGMSGDFEPAVSLHLLAAHVYYGVAAVGTVQSAWQYQQAEGIANVVAPPPL